MGKTFRGRSYRGHSFRSRPRARYYLLFVILWILFVLYPNPFRLVASLYRVTQPPVQPELVVNWLDDLPRDPAKIERFVLQTFPYQYDWITYGVPWYFPTVEEALDRGTGDCKTRYVVFASLLEAMDIPYTTSFSLSHFWVIYEDKTETPMERMDNAWLLRDDEGVRLQVPREDWQQIYDTFYEAFWVSMPPFRKGLLLAGPLLTVFAYFLRRRSARRIYTL